MDQDESNDTRFQRTSDWLPLVLIFSGYALAWIGLDSYAITMNVGFFCYGLLGSVLLIRRGYHSRISLKFLKIGLQVIIMILAVVNVFLPGAFLPIIMLILLDRLVLTPDRVEAKTFK